MNETVQRERPGRGRPRALCDQERRHQLLRAAETMFMTKGYHATTVDDVARGAGMSKKTVYRVFSSKADMFEGLLNDRFSPLTVPVEEAGRPLEAVLTDVLCSMASFILASHQIAMIRMMIAEAPFSRDMANALDRCGPGRGEDALERWVAAQAKCGVLRIDDPTEAAKTLLFAAIGDMLLTCLLKADAPPPDAVIKARIVKAVRVFLNEFAGPERTRLQAASPRSS